MNPRRCPRCNGCATYRHFRALCAFASLAGALPFDAVSLISLRATEPSTAAARTAPPAFADAVHVPNGCFISTLSYLAKFRAAYPEERGTNLTVVLRNFAGPHTIAVVTWRGQWWGRDEYSGVFKLRCAVAPADDIARLRTQATSTLEGIASRHLKSGRIAAAPVSLDGLHQGKRLAAVVAAADLLPRTSQIYWVRGHHGVVPFLFFQPAEGTVAVYDPASGTATGECALRNITTVVTMVANELGYVPTAVWPDSPQAAVAPLASASTARR